MPENPSGPRTVHQLNRDALVARYEEAVRRFDPDAPAFQSPYEGDKHHAKRNTVGCTCAFCKAAAKETT